MPGSGSDLSFSPLTRAARWMFTAAIWLSPMQWLRGPVPEFKRRRDLTRQEIESVEFARRRARLVELYLVAWFAIELLAVACVLAAHLNAWAQGIIAVVAALRVIEIVQVTMNTTVFDSMSGRADERVVSRARMIVLAAINYVELVVCFGLFYAMWWTSLHGAGQPATAFYFSAVTQLTIGYGDVYPTGWLRALAAAQGFTAVLFLVVVAGRFVASMPPFSGIIDSSDAAQQALLAERQER